MRRLILYPDESYHLRDRAVLIKPDLITRNDLLTLRRLLKSYLGYEDPLMLKYAMHVRWTILHEQGIVHRPIWWRCLFRSSHRPRPPLPHSRLRGSLVVGHSYFTILLRFRNVNSSCHIFAWYFRLSFKAVATSKVTVFSTKIYSQGKHSYLRKLKEIESHE